MNIFDYNEMIVKNQTKLESQEKKSSLKDNKDRTNITTNSEVKDLTDSVSDKAALKNSTDFKIDDNEDTNFNDGSSNKNRSDEDNYTFKGTPKFIIASDSNDGSRAISSLSAIELKNKLDIIDKTDYKDEDGAVLSGADGSGDDKYVDSSLEKKRKEEKKKITEQAYDFKIDANEVPNSILASDSSYSSRAVSSLTATEIADLKAKIVASDYTDIPDGKTAAEQVEDAIKLIDTNSTDFKIDANEVPNSILASDSSYGSRATKALSTKAINDKLDVIDKTEYKDITDGKTATEQKTDAKSAINGIGDITFLASTDDTTSPIGVLPTGYNRMSTLSDSEKATLKTSINANENIKDISGGKTAEEQKAALVKLVDEDITYEDFKISNDETDFVIASNPGNVSRAVSSLTATEIDAIIENASSAGSKDTLTGFVNVSISLTADEKKILKARLEETDSNNYIIDESETDSKLASDSDNNSRMSILTTTELTDLLDTIDKTEYKDEKGVALTGDDLIEKRKKEKEKATDSNNYIIDESEISKKIEPKIITEAENIRIDLFKNADFDAEHWENSKSDTDTVPTGIISNSTMADFRDSASLVGKDIDFMLLNFIPYGAQEVASIVNDIDNFADSLEDNGVQTVINAAQAGIDLFEKYSTYSLYETGKMFLQNAFTLMYIPGMKDFTVKLKKSLFNATPYDGKVTKDTLGFGSKGNDIGTADKIIERINKYKVKKQNAMKMFIYLDGGETINIPFQFMPNISESGRAAKFEASNMLHRQGSIYSYVGTESQTLTLETEFITLSDDYSVLDTEPWSSLEVDSEKSFWEKAKDLAEKAKNVTQDIQDSLSDSNKYESIDSDVEHSFYQSWNYNKIHSIESILRAIVLPKIGDDGGVSRPPIIKIQMGGNENLYSMLSYPYSGKNYLRTYVVTKVTITKDLKEDPMLYLKKGNMDTIGYKVSMELSELDASILTDNTGPSYNGYFEKARNYNELVGFKPDQAYSSYWGK